MLKLRIKETKSKTDSRAPDVAKTLAPNGPPTNTLRTGKKSDEGLGGRGEDAGGIPKEEKKKCRESSSESVLHVSKTSHLSGRRP